MDPPPNGAPQWGPPMSKWGLYLPVHPILQVKVPFYNQFLLNFYDAPPQRSASSGSQATSSHRVVLGEVVST